jgi:nucleoside-diphosphate-sugar epimerase
MSRDPAAAAGRIDPAAMPLPGDVLNPRDVARAVDEAQPEILMHQATAIPDPVDPRRVAQSMEQTNRLRREGARNLVAAIAKHDGVRLISQSIAFAYAPEGTDVASESAPLNLEAPKDFRPVVEGVAALERQTLEAGGVVLRYGHLYGPGTTYAPDGGTAELVRKRRMPLVGDGGGVFSFVHVNDAAAATVAAMDGPSGVLNITDDDPAPVRAWLPVLASTLGASKPRRIPVWLCRLVTSEWGVEYMTRLRGASNAEAKRVLDWRPQRPSWRDGFLDMASGGTA